VPQRPLGASDRVPGSQRVQEETPGDPMIDLNSEVVGQCLDFCIVVRDLHTIHSNASDVVLAHPCYGVCMEKCRVAVSLLRSSKFSTLRSSSSDSLS
jgi:hypothetical protein